MSHPDPASVQAFWQWWSTTVEPRDAPLSTEDETSEMTERVHRIHPDLEWEYTRADDAHVLVVSAAGDPALRAVAMAWHAAAPTVAGWRFHPSRQPDRRALSATVRVDGAEVDLSRTRFDLSVDLDRRQIDVVCCHPAFAGLGEETQYRVAWITLTAVLGEDGADLWIGAVSCRGDIPDSAVDATALAAAVHALTPADSEGPWLVLEGQSPNGPVLATVQTPLKPVRWPTYDTHLAVAVPYATATSQGWPTGASLDRLRELEDTLASDVDGRGELIAHESAAGVRIMHFYLAGPEPLSAAALAWIDAWPEGPVRIELRSDPGFEAVEHLAG